MSERAVFALAAKKRRRANRAMLTRVNELELSALTINYLQNDGILYVGDLIQKTEDELLHMPNFGRKRLNQIKELLAQMGLHLGIKVRGWPPANVKHQFDT